MNPPNKALVGAQYLWNSHTLQCIQVVLAAGNFLIAFTILIVLAAEGFTLKEEAGRYVAAMNLTPEKTGLAVEKTLGIVDNVHTVTNNMVPVSEAAVDVLTNNETTSVNNVTMAEAATGLLMQVGNANWTSLVGNASIALGSASLLNFTVVTDFVKQLTDPAFQATVKEQVAHALGSFDFAASGAGDFFQTIKKGIISQSKPDSAIANH